MLKTEIKQVPTEVLKASYSNVQPQSTSQYPIRLTAQNPYLAGRAALVFGSAHVVSMADDIAEFGVHDTTIDAYSDIYYAPYPGAGLVAWFRPSRADKNYNIDVTVVLHAPGTLSLEGLVGTETLEVDVGTGRTIGTTFYGEDTTIWRSFFVSYTNYWKVDHCEINELGG
jgi:hypothetical protein